MKYLLFVLLTWAVFPAYSAQLFGVNLSTATRDELRIAVKNAGVKVVQEAGIDAFFDIYEGDSVLHKAKYLYLGFVKKNQKFAFAEYEFNGLKQPVMLQKLTAKYGKTKPMQGKYFSDVSHSWLSDGIKITLYQDWKGYKTRLTYIDPAALNQLKEEKNQYQLATKQANVNYLEMAY